jgi:hypothetical protein
VLEEGSLCSFSWLNHDTGRLEHISVSYDKTSDLLILRKDRGRFRRLPMTLAALGPFAGEASRRSIQAHLQHLVMEWSVHLTKAACTARGSLRRASAKGWPTAPVGLAYPPRKESFFGGRSETRFCQRLFFHACYVKTKIPCEIAAQ